MQVNTRAALAALAIGIVLSLLSGCGMAESQNEVKVASQEAQLREFTDQADAWGADIIGQIPADETESVSGNLGGSRQSSANYEEWPKYYSWDQGVDLRPDGTRTPAELIEDLEPWLEEQGWVRNSEKEFPPGEESFERSYLRGGYSLIVVVYTMAPPQAQTVDFVIVTPSTDPDLPPSSPSGQ